eukprot:764300-Hanusia_phi.AAC.2
MTRTVSATTEEQKETLEKYGTVTGPGRPVTQCQERPPGGRAGRPQCRRPRGGPSLFLHVHPHPTSHPLLKGNLDPTLVYGTGRRGVDITGGTGPHPHGSSSTLLGSTPTQSVRDMDDAIRRMAYGDARVGGDGGGDGGRRQGRQRCDVDDEIH